jgi:hypothetical protein
MLGKRFEESFPVRYLWLECWYNYFKTTINVSSSTRDGFEVLCKQYCLSKLECYMSDSYSPNFWESFDSYDFCHECSSHRWIEVTKTYNLPSSWKLSWRVDTLL